MTDIVERLRFLASGQDDPQSVALANAADEIERLRTEAQELKLQYLSDQGQWIEETGRLRDEFTEMREDLVYLNKMCMTLMSLLPPETTPEDVRAAMAKQGSHVREEKRIITDV